MQDAFEEIYREGRWDGGGSGAGSCPEDAGHFFAWLASRVRPGSSLLDVGCGDGRLAAVYAPWCGRYTGVDLAPSAIAAARPRLPSGAQLVLGTLDDLPPDAQWDWVLVKDVLQHLPWGAVRDLLAAATGRARWSVLIVEDHPQTFDDDILPGEYRPVDPRMPPLALRAAREAVFRIGRDRKAAFRLCRIK
jgi:SAM-dependent methyltransferase